MKRLLVPTLLLLLGSSGALANLVDDRDPWTIIEETTTLILEALDERREEFSADPEKLRTIVREDLIPLLDLDYSARLILGRAGREVSPEQLDAFARAMSGVLINRYADGLLDFRSDKQVVVLPIKGKNTEKLTGNHPFSLDEGSPCIDLGSSDTTGLMLLPWDIVKNIRIWVPHPHLCNTSPMRADASRR